MHLELLQNRSLGKPGVTGQRYLPDAASITGGVAALPGCAAKAQVMMEIKTKAAIRLASAAGNESVFEVVLHYPDLVRAIHQVHRVDQLQLPGEVLAHGEACGGIRFRCD